MAILARHGVPDHIQSHCLRVAQVAGVIARELNKRGLNLNRELVISSSLLHDVTKMDAIISGQDHAITGSRLLEGLGYPEVANLVRQHVYVDDPETDCVTEAHVLSYADKRVLHSDVVNLDERFADLMIRYGHTAERRISITHGLEWARGLEQRIFSIINMAPEMLLLLNQYEPDHEQEEMPWRTDSPFSAIPHSG